MCKNSKKWSILIRPQELLTAASLLLEDTRHSLIGNAIGLRLEKTNSAYTEGILKSIPFLRQCSVVRDLHLTQFGGTSADVSLKIS